MFELVVEKVTSYSVLNSVSVLYVLIYLPVVWRKAHTNDVAVDIDDMVQGIKKLI